MAPANEQASRTTRNFDLSVPSSQASQRRRITLLHSPYARRLVVQFGFAALAPLGLLSAAAALDPGLSALLNGGILAAAAGAGLVVGAVFASREARRVRALARAARRIARHDFAAAAPATDGGDEVGEIGRSLRLIGKELDAGIVMQRVLTQMDEAILKKLDVGALVNGALRCLRQSTEARVVMLGLFESADMTQARVFIRDEDASGRIDSRKLALTMAHRKVLLLETVDVKVDDAPFPPDFLDVLRTSHGVQHLHLVSVAREGRGWGFIGIAYATRVSPSARQRRLLGGISARLIAGFLGAERDEKLHSLAFVDALTGLPNRGAMPGLFAAELERTQKMGRRAAILFIDLDRFKHVNDTLGHASGDRLLVQAAHRIRSHVREDDAVARIGGDEFLVVLSGLSEPREAGRIARKLIQALSRRFDLDGQTAYCGGSVGIAIYPDDGTDGAELLKLADTAMYRAKSEGRNRYAYFEEPMNLESKRRSKLDGELRGALQRRELVLHYQPQIDLRTGTLWGVECLVRWQHPTRGLLPPREFIEYAEEIGLIPEIGTWVLTEACLQYKRWQDAGVKVPRIAVNVSNGQLPRSNFVPMVRQLIETFAIPPGALEVEVTETMIANGGRVTADALNLLDELGVVVAIDDFGTGYSSFSYLKTMQARVLKLDMSFLVDAREDNAAGKIVAAIVNMAHALQKEVVAEGIEDVEQLRLLKSLDCERGQGYLFGRPVPAGHIERAFARDGRGEPEFSGDPGTPELPFAWPETDSGPPSDAEPITEAGPITVPGALMEAGPATGAGPDTLPTDDAPEPPGSGSLQWSAAMAAWPEAARSAH